MISEGSSHGIISNPFFSSCNAIWCAAEDFPQPGDPVIMTAILCCNVSCMNVFAEVGMYFLSVFFHSFSVSRQISTKYSLIFELFST